MLIILLDTCLDIVNNTEVNEAPNSQVQTPASLRINVRLKLYLIKYSNAKCKSMLREDKQDVDMTMN
jgi:hypothetical protein